MLSSASLVPNEGGAPGSASQLVRAGELTLSYSLRPRACPRSPPVTRAFWRRQRRGAVSLMGHHRCLGNKASRVVTHVFLAGHRPTPTSHSRHQGTRHRPHLGAAVGRGHVVPCLSTGSDSGWPWVYGPWGAWAQEHWVEQSDVFVRLANRSQLLQPTGLPPTHPLPTHFSLRASLRAGFHSRP